MSLQLILNILFLGFTSTFLLGQDLLLSKTTETLWEIGGLNYGSYYGYKESQPVFLHRIARRNNNFEGILLDENERSTEALQLKFKPPYEESSLLTGYLDLENFHQNKFFYNEGFSNDDFTVYYQNLLLQYNGEDNFLDSIYNADKKIHSSFNSDGRYLLVNTLNTLSDYYNPQQDNQIMVYDLHNIDKGEISKEYIPCTHCSDSYLIEDQLFFTMGRKDGYSGFSNKDIYVAPWGNLADSVKIASNTEIKAISPDGKYILGTRFWDRQKNTAVIVDVEQKKFQMLLGRDYAQKKAFYSHNENKFAFDFKGYLIYVDFPQSYPFDALKWRNEEIPDWTEEEFWAKYEHPPLAEE